MATLKHELDQWNEGVIAFDQGLYEEALEIFGTIADSAKIYFNIGVVFTTIGNFKAASVAYSRATKLDQYFAIAYFQNGVANVAMEEYERALRCFNDAHMYLRGNMVIDYTQLGLDFKLYSCQVLFNRALCKIELGDDDDGMRDLWRASREKQTKAHDVLDQALRDRGQDCTVFTIPEGVLYRPSETKVKNAKKKDYLGNSKVIAAVDASDQFAGFKGKSAWQVQMSGPTNITPIEQPRPMTPPNGLQRRATERILNHGNGIERPHMLEHSASFSGSEGLPRRAGAGSSPSPLGHGNLGVPPSIEAKSLKRRNTEKRPAALNTSFDGNNGPRSGGGPISSTPSSTMYSGHGSNGGGGRSHFQDELDEIEEQVYALSMETGRSFGGVSDGMNSVGASPTTIGTGMVVPNTGIMGLARSNTMLSTTPNGVRPTIDRMQSQKKQISPPGSNYTSPVMSGAGSNGKMNGGGVSPPGQSRQVPGFSDLRRVGSSAGGGLMRGNSVRSAISSPSTVASPRAYGGASSRIEEGSIMEEPILKIRVKCHYIDTRAVLVRVDTPLQELLQRIQEKFQSDRPLKLKYKDEDLHMLSMIDDEDWTMALQVHQATTGSPDRMELWCYDDE